MKYAAFVFVFGFLCFALFALGSWENLNNEYDNETQSRLAQDQATVEAEAADYTAKSADVRKICSIWLWQHNNFSDTPNFSSLDKDITELRQNGILNPTFLAQYSRQAFACTVIDGHTKYHARFNNQEDMERWMRQATWDQAVDEFGQQIEVIKEDIKDKADEAMFEASWFAKFFGFFLLSILGILVIGAISLLFR